MTLRLILAGAFAVIGWIWGGLVLLLVAVVLHATTSPFAFV